MPHSASDAFFSQINGEWDIVIVFINIFPTIPDKMDPCIPSLFHLTIWSEHDKLSMPCSSSSGCILMARGSPVFLPQELRGSQCSSLKHSAAPPHGTLLT